MLRSIADSFSAFVGSITAPDASLNHVLTSTSTVRFLLLASTVTGLAKSTEIFASTPEVNVNGWSVPPASVNTPTTFPLTPWNPGWAVRKSFAPSSSLATAPSLARRPRPGRQTDSLGCVRPGRVADGEQQHCGGDEQNPSCSFHQSSEVRMRS